MGSTSWRDIAPGQCPAAGGGASSATALSIAPHVLNNPSRYTDPTGHRNCEEDGYNCPGSWYNSGSGGGSSGGGSGDGGGSSTGRKTTKLLDTILNSYEQGWKYFGDAVSNCHVGISGVVPCAYASAWAGAHTVIIAGTVYITWEAIVGSAAACGLNPECEQEVGQSVQNIPDDAFVRYDPVISDSSINESGLLTRFSETGQTWLTQYKYVSGVNNATDLETMLYSQDLWASKAGTFAEGATLRLVNIDSATPAGVTNMVNGIPQWFVTSNIPPDLLQIIRVLPGE